MAKKKPDAPIGELSFGDVSTSANSGTASPESAPRHSDSRESASARPDASARADAGGRDSDSGSSGASRLGSIGRSGATDIEDGSDDFDLPIGDVVTTRRNRQRSGNGGNSAGARGRPRNRTGANNNAGTGATETPATSDSESVPREVGYEQLGKKGKVSAKEGALSKEFFAEGWSIAFTVAGSVVKDRETWKLESDDADEIAERTQAWIASLDAKRYAALQKKIAKYQPFLMLCMGLTSLVGPRIAQTMAKKRAKPTPTQTKDGRTFGSGSASGGATAPAPATPNDMAQAPINGASGNGATGTSVNFRPLGRFDVAQDFDNDYSGPMGQGV